ncbi:MAG TPA: bifunctional pyr operon transcriptional regulator/uracil phosphoribosyltransferase PyrR [Burkholderiaceae bacterium]|nr:bifunctional pyr operon transcriptional regulator/uracil phosphoribosyltransferase PyrR [Burkholderiaceae bacterium]
MSSQGVTANSASVKGANSQVIETETLDAEALYTQLREYVTQAHTSTTHLVGITSGGAWLVERLQQDLKFSMPFGIISSSMHRDDFSQRGISGAGQTHLPFEVNDADILLLDDVLYTGRTIRAVVNELFDYGRPERVRLAVLVDRGGRELPVHAEFAAAKLTLPANQTLSLAKSSTGQFSLDVRSTDLGKPKEPVNLQGKNK